MAHCVYKNIPVLLLCIDSSTCVELVHSHSTTVAVNMGPQDVLDIHIITYALCASLCVIYRISDVRQMLFTTMR